MANANNTQIKNKQIYMAHTNFDLHKKGIASVAKGKKESY